MDFSIVTPCLNAGKYIAETIESVIFQKGTFAIDYLIVDGGSSDGTADIVRSYQELLNAYPALVRCSSVNLRWTSSRDEGMYEALNKGFAQMIGTVMAWINADDVYLPGALNRVASVFRTYEEIAWFKGVTSYIGADSDIETVGEVNLYCQDWLELGVYGRELQFVQQDSVFWRSSLLAKVGGFPRGLKLAGDYWLWCEFAKHEPLYSSRVYTSCFRRSEGQLSENLEAYRTEMRQVLPREVPKARLFRRLLRCEGVFPAWLLRALYRLFIGRHLYHGVIHDGGGMTKKIEGDYWTVKSAI